MTKGTVLGLTMGIALLLLLSGATWAGLWLLSLGRPSGHFSTIPYSVHDVGQDSVVIAGYGAKGIRVVALVEKTPSESLSERFFTLSSTGTVVTDASLELPVLHLANNPSTGKYVQHDKYLWDYNEKEHMLSIRGVPESVTTALAEGRAGVVAFQTEGSKQGIEVPVLP